MGLFTVDWVHEVWLPLGASETAMKALFYGFVFQTLLFAFMLMFRYVVWLTRKMSNPERITVVEN